MVILEVLNGKNLFAELESTITTRSLDDQLIEDILSRSGIACQELRLFLKEWYQPPSCSYLVACP